MNRTVIMGLDPSLNGSAIAIMFEGRIIHTARLGVKTRSFRGDKYLEFNETDEQDKFIETLKSTVDKENNPFYKMERVNIITDWIVGKLDRFGVTFVMMEGYSFASRGALIDLAELGGSLKSQFLKRDIKYDVIAPTTLKKAITGHGHADKEMIRESLIELENIDIPNDDVADAYALAIVGRDREL